jgi:hypothetical protein
MSHPVEILITPSGRGRYCAWLGDPAYGGRVLAEAREPFFAAARRLLAEGMAPETVVSMRHHGSTVRSLTMTLGKAAKLAVREREDGGAPTIVRWKPSHFGDVRPPIEQKGEEAAE